jgi:hypothetical protein
MPNVSFIRPEVVSLTAQYTLIRDCLAGETAIKDAKTVYLPMPNATDKSAENKSRYDAYIKRAVFYNVTRRTMTGLLGQVFMREPVLKVPALLQPIVDNASGTGVTLVQSAKRSELLTLAYSRSGVLVDYPTTEGGATMADLASGKIHPTISTYEPLEIINWRIIQRGAEELLALVVLFELYEIEDDGFEMKKAVQFRVLKLDAKGEYVQEIWREKLPTPWNGKMKIQGNFEPGPSIEMLGADGNKLREIPFMFIGSENNDPTPDNPNLYDLASLNVAHYRNSADYEETCFIVGQPTPVLTGLTEEWVDKVLKGTINFGSRGGIPLPAGASAELLQAQENTMIKEAMDTKERQMVALGAKLVQEKQVQRTAFEAKMESTGESSTLSTTTKNVSAAYLWALKWCAKLLGVPETEIEFELNTDYDIATKTPEERAEVIKEWQAGALTFEEMRSCLRKAGVATEDDVKAKSAIAAETAAAMALAMPPNVPGVPAPANVGNKPKGA